MNGKRQNKVVINWAGDHKKVSEDYGGKDYVKIANGIKIMVGWGE